VLIRLVLQTTFVQLTNQIFIIILMLTNKIDTNWKQNFFKNMHRKNKMKVFMGYVAKIK
jgi:hypothetical protein